MKLLLCFLLFQLTACSSYLENRRHDLTDSASINATAFGRGVKLDMGPFSTGFYELFSSYGTTMKFGLGGVEQIDYGHKIEVLGVGLAATGYKSDGNYHNSRWGYGHKILPFAAFKFDIGYIIPLGVQIDFLEIIDLVLGLATIDIMQDDISSTEELEEKCCTNSTGPPSLEHAHDH